MTEPIYITEWKDLEGETIERAVGDGCIYINRELVEAGWMTEEERKKLLEEKKATEKANRAAKKEARDRATYEKLRKRFGDE